MKTEELLSDLCKLNRNLLEFLDRRFLTIFYRKVTEAEGDIAGVNQRLDKEFCGNKKPSLKKLLTFRMSWSSFIFIHKPRIKLRQNREIVYLIIEAINYEN